MSKSPELKLVVLGPGGVGKSCITVQFVQNRFLEDYDPTIEDFYRKQVNIDGKSYLLEILDTAGQEEYAAMRDQYLQSGSAFLLVYSITSRASFEEINNFRDQVQRIKDKLDFPMILVGNKSDLEDMREVSPEEGRNLARSFNCPFFETSARQKLNIEESFHTLVKEWQRREGSTGSTEKKKKSCTML